VGHSIEFQVLAFFSIFHNYRQVEIIGSRQQYNAVQTGQLAAKPQGNWTLKGERSFFRQDSRDCLDSSVALSPSACPPSAALQALAGGDEGEKTQSRL